MPRRISELIPNYRPAKVQGSAKAAQDNLSPEQNKRVLAALSKLPPAGDEEVAASTGVLRNPRDTAARAHLRAAQGDVKGIVDDLINALINSPDGAISGGEIYYDDDVEVSSESEEELTVLPFNPAANIPPPGTFFFPSPLTCAFMNAFRALFMRYVSALLICL